MTLRSYFHKIHQKATPSLIVSLHCCDVFWARTFIHYIYIIPLIYKLILSIPPPHLLHQPMKRPGFQTEMIIVHYNYILKMEVQKIIAKTACKELSLFKNLMQKKSYHLIDFMKKCGNITTKSII